jgi:hypothetical protein
MSPVFNTCQSKPMRRRQKIAEAISSRQAADMLQVARVTYSHQEDWRFYGKNHGWAVPFSKSGQAVVSLCPAQRSLTRPGSISRASQFLPEGKR